jgi:hypothetical protein
MKQQLSNIQLDHQKNTEDFEFRLNNFVQALKSFQDYFNQSTLEPYLARKDANNTEIAREIIDSTSAIQSYFRESLDHVSQAFTALMTSVCYVKSPEMLKIENTIDSSLKGDRAVQNLKECLTKLKALGKDGQISVNNFSEVKQAYDIHSRIEALLKKHRNLPSDLCMNPKCLMYLYDYVQAQITVANKLGPTFRSAFRPEQTVEPEYYLPEHNESGRSKRAVTDFNVFAK